MKKNLSTNDRGQNLSEYTLLLALIMGGILIGGPFAVNSWNGQVESWEDSVIDSFTDPLPEAHPRETECVCDENWSTPSIPGDCGGDGCHWSEARQVRNCSPLGCGSESQCIPDEGCCSPPSLLPGCGVNADPACPGGCPDGEQCGSQQCGSDPTLRYGCFPGDCAQCVGGPFVPGTGTLCPGDTQGLAVDTPYFTVTPGGCTDPRKCEVECVPPNVPINGNSDCGVPSLRQPCDGSFPFINVYRTGRYTAESETCPEPYVITENYNWAGKAGNVISVRPGAVGRSDWPKYEHESTWPFNVYGDTPYTSCWYEACPAQLPRCFSCGWHCGNGICESGQAHNNVPDETCASCPEDCAVPEFDPTVEFVPVPGTPHVSRLHAACGYSCGNGVCEEWEVAYSERFPGLPPEIFPEDLSRHNENYGPLAWRTLSWRLVCQEDCYDLYNPEICGDGICGGLGYTYPPENCDTCPEDCSPLQCMSRIRANWFSG